MFWHKPKHEGAVPNWTAPTKPLDMTFAKWREWTKEADELRIGSQDMHFYLTTGACC